MPLSVARANRVWITLTQEGMLSMDISTHCYSFSFNFKLNCLKITVNVNFTTKRAGREVSKETEFPHSSHTNVLI